VRLRDRSAVDLVVLGIVVILGFILIVSSVSVLVLELVHPQVDTVEIVRVEGEILGVLVGALVGFIGGRAHGRSKANGKPPPGP
jgi:hypothetical protein